MPKPSVLSAILGATLIAGCAEPNPQLPPPQEILLVVNTTGGSLSAVPVDATGSQAVISLSGTVVSGVAALGPIVVAPLPNDDAADIVTLLGTQVIRTVGLPAGSGALGVSVINDTIAYVANPNLNSITQINMLTGDTASLSVGIYPQGLIATRGRLFVISGNVSACAQPGGLCSLGPSWLNVVDPANNALATGIDSIPLLGEGNARYAVVGRDGLLYVMSRGVAVESRLSIVDPVGRKELASFGGFGMNPGPLASDGGDRILVSSRSEGVMAFNTITRTVDRGAGNGVAIPENSGIAVDGSFRSYAIESGDCTGQTGTSVVLDSTLAPIRSFGLGLCAGEAIVTHFPSEAQP